MKMLHTVGLALFLMPGLLLAQTWTFTPPAYPAVCTNPAVVGEWTMDYATATNRAQTEGRNLYLLVTGSTWCPDCDTLQRQVMATPEMHAFMQASDAYWVWLDLPSRRATNAVQYGWLCHTNTGLFTLEESEAILARNRSLEARYGAIKGYRTPVTLNMPTFVVCRPDGTYQGEVTHYRQWTFVTADFFIHKIRRVWNDDAWDVQDNAVPGRSDDAAPTATALTNIAAAVEQHQDHTLSPTDSEDWYSFAAKPGKVYTFAAQGRLLDGQAALPAGQVNVEVFVETNDAAVPVAAAYGSPDQPQTVTWSLNQVLPRKVYVRVSGTFAERMGYTFTYGQITVAPPPASSMRNAEGAVINVGDCSRVTGVLSFSVTRSGWATVKYRTSDKTVSFSKKDFWTTFDENGVLTSVFSAGDYQVIIQMPSVDEVYAVVADPDYASPLTASLSTSPWSSANPATSFLGYYTVVLLPETIVGEHAPTGYSYMTILLKSISAKTGKVTYAGKLSDGTGYSGSAVLKPAEDGSAQLVIFARSGKHHLSGLLSIASPEKRERLVNPGAVTACGGIQPYWSNEGAQSETSFGMTLDVSGLFYSRENSLRDYFERYAAGETTVLMASGTVPSSAAYGVATALPFLPLGISGETVKIQPDAPNPTRTRLSVNPATGLFRGSFKIPFEKAAGRTRNVTATYAGVLLPGWEPDEGCDLGCGDTDPGVPEIPFGLGSYHFLDKAPVGIGDGARMVPFNAGYPILIGKAVR